MVVEEEEEDMKAVDVDLYSDTLSSGEQVNPGEETLHTFMKSLPLSNNGSDFKWQHKSTGFVFIIVM